MSNTIVPKVNTVSGTLNVNVTTATQYTDISGAVFPNGLYMYTIEVSGAGAKAWPIQAVTLAGTSVASNPLSTTLKNTTTTSVAATLNATSLTKLFRAFDKRWIQIA